MSDVIVTVTEMDAARDEFDYTEGERTCTGPVCNHSVIGYHLAENPDTGQDEQAFTRYWEIAIRYPHDIGVEYERLCEDCLDYWATIAPAVVAFNS